MYLLYTKIHIVKPLCEITRLMIAPKHIMLASSFIIRQSTFLQWLFGLLDMVLLAVLQHHCNSIHYSDVIMSVMASQITATRIDFSTIFSGVDQGKHQSSTSLAFVRGIHQWPVDSPYKGPVKWKIFHLMTSSCIWSFKYGVIICTAASLQFYQNSQ